MCHCNITTSIECLSLSFVVRHSSFVIRHSSFVLRHSSFVVHRSSFVVNNLLKTEHLKTHFSSFIISVSDFDYLSFMVLYSRWINFCFLLFVFLSLSFFALLLFVRSKFAASFVRSSLCQRRTTAKNDGDDDGQRQRTTTNDLQRQATTTCSLPQKEKTKTREVDLMTCRLQLLWSRRGWEWARTSSESVHRPDCSGQDCCLLERPQRTVKWGRR